MSIEGGSGEDDLRERGGGANGAIEPDAVSVSDAVQRLRPPLVGGNPEPRNGRSGADELGDFLIQRETRNEVTHPLADGQSGIAERKRLGQWVCGVASKWRRRRLIAMNFNQKQSNPNAGDEVQQKQAMESHVSWLATLSHQSEDSNN